MTDWKTKYPIGSQWKCRDGSRAVVVGYSNDSYRNEVITIYRDITESVTWVTEGGLRMSDHDCDLIEPWEEPRVFEDDVIVLANGEMHLSGGYGNPIGARVIAKKTVTITEGEGLNDLPIRTSNTICPRSFKGCGKRPDEQKRHDTIAKAR